MILRNGNYTYYNGFDLQLFEVRQDEPIPFTHFLLKYKDEINCPISGFTKSDHGGFIKFLERSEVKNAFYVSTHALYLGNVFKAETNYPDLTCVLLSTYDINLSKQLSLYTFYDERSKPYYGNAFKLTEIERLWEERTPSKYELPMPEGIESNKRIEI